MKALTKLALVPVVMLLALGPALQAPAQQSEFKPAVVVSLASFDEIFGDLSYLAETAGAKDYMDIARGMAGVFTDGLDKQRPAGAFLMFEPGADEPKAIVFIPVANLEKLLATHERNIGRAEREGDLLRIEGPNGSVYIKEAAGWAFASQDKDALAITPGDPTALLGSLTKDYTVAVKVKAENIPQPLRELAIGELQRGFESGLAEQSPEDRELLEGLSRRQMESLRMLIEETDELLIGWNVDSMAKKTYLDITMTARAGTDLAKQFAEMGDGTSAFSGFLASDAAGALHFSGTMSKDDVEQLTLLVDAASKKAVQAIEEDEDLDDPAKRTAAKDIVTSLFAVARKTAQSGKMNGGATLMMGETSLTFAAGGHVADAAELERVLRVAADLAKDEPKFPGIKFDADKHAGVTFHTMRIPLDDDDAQKVFGEQLDVAIGVGKDSFYLAFGNDSVATLKKIIDTSAAGAEQKLPPSQFFVALAPILKFAASMGDDEALAVAARAAEKVRGNDRISITSTMVERGARSRIELDEGVLKLIGETVMTMSGQAGARP